MSMTENYCSDFESLHAARVARYAKNAESGVSIFSDGSEPDDSMYYQQTREDKQVVTIESIIEKLESNELVDELDEKIAEMEETLAKFKRLRKSLGGSTKKESKPSTGRLTGDLTPKQLELEEAVIDYIRENGPAGFTELSAATGHLIPPLGCMVARSKRLVKRDDKSVAIVED